MQRREWEDYSSQAWDGTAHAFQQHRLSFVLMQLQHLNNKHWKNRSLKGHSINFTHDENSCVMSSLALVRAFQTLIKAQNVYISLNVVQIFKYERSWKNALTSWLCLLHCAIGLQLRGCIHFTFPQVSMTFLSTVVLNGRLLPEVSSQHPFPTWNPIHLTAQNKTINSHNYVQIVQANDYNVNCTGNFSN